MSEQTHGTYIQHTRGIAEYAWSEAAHKGDWSPSSEPEPVTQPMAIPPRAVETVEPDFDYERVTDGNECPYCGEDEMDRLVWDDQDWVTCTTCGTIYDPERNEVSKWGEIV